VLINLGLNAEVDIATRDEQKADFDSLLKKSNRLPLMLPLVASNVGEFSSGGNGIIDLGSPPTGKIWNILSFALFGSDDHTAVTGTAALYVDSTPTAQALALANLRVPNLAIPNSQFISKQTLWAHSSGNVVFNLAGLSSNTTAVNATMTVAEYHDGDISAMSTR
jgi:hypothetical protein